MAKNSTTNNSINLVVQAPNGQQIIKIVRNNNSQPLTKEGVKAIVKEVTHQQNLLNNHTIVRNVGIKQEHPHQQLQQHIFQQPHYQSQYDTATSSSTMLNKTTSIKLTVQQMAAIKANAQPPSKLPMATSAYELQNYAGKIINSSTSKPSMVIVGGSGINDNKNNNISNMQPMQPIVVKPSGSTGKKSQVTTPIVRRRKTDRLGKGLRHFSMKVCEKVKEKGKTTYNEVADELVTEEVEVHPIDPANYDQKNIRRRVYDALNVLMAMNIISKDKKEIRWIGLPTNSAQQCTSLELENKKRKESIAAKQQQLRDLILQLVSFKSLVTRNKEAEDRGIIPSQSSAIQLPFIIVNTHKKTHINCSISNDKSEYFFKFDNKFEIHDDIDVLKRMGLLLGLDKGECTYEDIERAKTMVPKTFEKYIECYGRGQDENTDDYDMDLNYGHEPKIEPSSGGDDDNDDEDNDHFTDEASELD